jgi:citrate lyase beta subunit
MSDETIADVRHKLHASRTNMAALDWMAADYAEEHGVSHSTAREILLRIWSRNFHEIQRQIRGRVELAP